MAIPFFSLVSLLALAVQALNASYIDYSTVPGYFLQDLNSTNATNFDYTAVNFGLINQSYPATTTSSLGGTNLTQWQQFALQVSLLNIQAPAGTEYKVLFLGRHGEGYHNAAESFYGTPAWNCYWAELNGNGTTTWDDAVLTSNGITQAHIANTFWAHEMSVQKIPVPQRYYTSPLRRCLATANITFSGLELPAAQPFIPTIKHGLREGISIHTCDRRSNKTYIHSLYPDWPFEPNFPEYDQLWNGVTAETSAAQNVRSKMVLDDIFGSDDSTYISITSHSGEIASILSVLGHRPFSLSTGAVIPVLVKAVTSSSGPASTTTALAWTPSPHCTSPPVTSVSGGACVCAAGASPVTSLLPSTETGPAVTTSSSSSTVAAR